MARFLIMSGEGDGLGIGLRLKDEGHEVVAVIKKKEVKSDYDGILRKADKFNDALVPGTIVLFDQTGGGKTADRVRGQGYPTLGASVFAEQLEMDRHLAAGMAEEADIRIPPSRHFTSFQDGIAYAQERDRLCFKADNNKVRSYLASGSDDMIDFLEGLQREGETADFELQDFVKGLEISTEMWFDGVDFARPLNHTFERKQLMNDNLGPSGGCAGNVVWACTTDYCRICEEGIKRFAPILRHHGYHGMIDLNAIVNDEGVWWLEWTPRFGFEAFPALMEMFTEPVSDTLARYARGERIKEFPMIQEGFGAGLKVTIPPYPTKGMYAQKDIRIQNLTRADRIHSYFYNVYLDDKGQLRTTGGFGAIAVFTAFGDDIASAMGKCQEIADRADIRNKQYRTDLASIFEKSYSEFRQIAAKPAEVSVV